MNYRRLPKSISLAGCASRADMLARIVPALSSMGYTVVDVDRTGEAFGKSGRGGVMRNSLIRSEHVSCIDQQGRHVQFTF